MSSSTALHPHLPPNPTPSLAGESSGRLFFKEKSTAIDEAFTTQVKSLIEKIYSQEQGKDDALKEFESLCATSPQRLAKTIQHIALDKKQSYDLRLIATTTLFDKALPLRDETIKSLSKEIIKDPLPWADPMTALSFTIRNTDAFNSIGSIKDPFFEHVSSLLSIRSLSRKAADILVALDPMKGLAEYCKTPRYNANDFSRDVLISETAQLNPKEALEFLKNRSASEPDLQALSLGIWFSEKIPREQLLKLDDSSLATIIAAVGPLPGVDTKDFLQTALKDKDIGFRTEQTALVCLLNQGDTSILTRLASSLIVQSSIFQQQQSKIQNTNEIIGQFLQNGGYDAFINAIEEATKQLATPAEAATADYLYFGKLLKENFTDAKEQNFSTPLRFMPTVLQQLLKENKTPTKDPEKLAVVVLPVADWNGAFDTFAPAHSLLLKGYTVRLCIAGTDEEATRFIEKVAKDQRAPDVVVIGGHGSPDTLQLGVKNGDETTIDLTDADILSRINRSIHKDTIVILEACATARKEGRKDPTLFEEFRQKLTLPGKNKIFAASAETSGFTFIYDKDNKVVGVTFHFPFDPGRTVSG